ncbi:hypothetical protein Pcinc_031716 [Petrolisthes cinctipes]|uniref:Right handed beta helix domain-containing protein n=1 Tax=Petrolisthes cinctipes TaxID=88211 RepID=A0AAE1EW50_PETCI|nr:hypothetical protein Pcinc_031716 [Petrolisthes cinctipes]
MSLLPDALKSLPQITSESICETFPNLQSALNEAKKQDTIVILPGQHLLQHLGLISTGGAIIGVGEGVEVYGRCGMGDVMLDITDTFTIHNITLIPTQTQVAILHHQGKLSLSNVIIKDGSGGVIGLGNTESNIQGVNIECCKGIGLDWREGANAIINNTTIRQCHVGMKIEHGAKVCVVGCNIERNNKYGLFVLLGAEGTTTDLTKFNDIPKHSLMEW